MWWDTTEEINQEGKGWAPIFPARRQHAQHIRTCSIEPLTIFMKLHLEVWNWTQPESINAKTIPPLKKVRFVLNWGGWGAETRGRWTIFRKPLPRWKDSWYALSVETITDDFLVNKRSVSKIQDVRSFRCRTFEKRRIVPWKWNQPSKVLGS